jgi:DNA-binding transcriptional ArsR family regulator
LKILDDAGLVEDAKPMGKDKYYRITNFGERVAMGTVESEELRELDPSE